MGLRSWKKPPAHVRSSSERPRHREASLEPEIPSSRRHWSRNTASKPACSKSLTCSEKGWRLIQQSRRPASSRQYRSEEYAQHPFHFVDRP